jgi:putative hydrolase of the HAD superfamily
LTPKRFKRDYARYESAFQLGRLSLEDFWEIAGKGYGVAFEDFANAFLNVYEIDDDVAGIMRQLAGRYRLIMLSENFDLLSATVRNDPAIAGIFDKMLFSNEMHMAKKAPACFHYALREISARPDECVFIDDERDNLISALAAGVRTIRFKDAQSLKRRLESHGVTFVYSSAAS